MAAQGIALEVHYLQKSPPLTSDKHSVLSQFILCVKPKLSGNREKYSLHLTVQSN